MSDTEILNQTLKMLESNANTRWLKASHSPEREFSDIAAFIREERKNQLNPIKKAIRYENLGKRIY